MSKQWEEMVLSAMPYLYEFSCIEDDDRWTYDAQSLVFYWLGTSSPIDQELLEGSSSCYSLKNELSKLNIEWVLVPADSRWQYGS